MLFNNHKANSIFTGNAKTARISFYCVAAICSTNIASASEIDSFTRRFEPLTDSAPIINAKANELFAGALERANTEKSCKENALFSEVTKDFNIILKHSSLVEFIVSSPEIARHTVPREESIYKYHTKADGLLLVRPAADTDGIGMGVTINFNGMYIGSDKFEHMFGQGHLYFTSFYDHKSKLSETLRLGITNERVYLGGNTLNTGVFSYADLFANFNGMRFWNSILAKNEDLLSENNGPYVQCESNKWVQIKKIDFSAYISSGFDEGYNCPSIITAHGLSGVEQAIAELNDKNLTDRFKCPIDDGVMKQLREKFELPVNPGSKDTIADFIFNPLNKITKYKTFWAPTTGSILSIFDKE